MSLTNLVLSLLSIYLFLKEFSLPCWFIIWLRYWNAYEQLFKWFFFSGPFILITLRIDFGGKQGQGTRCFAAVELTQIGIGKWNGAVSWELIGIQICRFPQLLLFFLFRTRIGAVICGINPIKCFSFSLRIMVILPSSVYGDQSSQIIV